MTRAPKPGAAAAGVCVVGKALSFQVEGALGVPLAENVAMIRDSVAAAAAKAEALFDAEHFFDGYKANPDYAHSCLKAAEAAGARWIVLCDNHGGTLPEEGGGIVGERGGENSGAELADHGHNEHGNEGANSPAARDDRPVARRPLRGVEPGRRVRREPCHGRGDRRVPTRRRQPSSR